MNQEALKKCMKALDKMPEEELKYLSDNNTVMTQQLYTYAKCLETGNFRGWENLKILSKIK